MSYFYTSRNGLQEGPLSVETIREKIKSAYFTSKDYIYYDQTKAWIALNEFKETADLFSGKEMVTESEIDPENSWYILKGEEKFGPFSYLDLVRMLQEKSIEEYDYIWNEKMVSWLRVSDCEEFSHSKLQSLAANQNITEKKVFFRRRFARATYSSSLVIHNNLRIWKGQSFQISAGGAGLTIENSNLVKGDEVYLHFKPSSKVPPFNAQCEVVAIHEVKNAKGIITQQLGVRFLKVNYAIQKVINEFVNELKETKVSRGSKVA